MLTALLADIRERDFVSPQRMSRRLRLPLAELAKLAHVHRNTLAQRPDSPVVQKGLEPVVRILAAAEQLTGDADRAIVWFRHQPIAGHDGRTRARTRRGRPCRGGYGALGGPPGRRLRVSWRLDAARSVAVRARFWRMLAPRWAFDPLSGAGPARAGGRWNEPGQAALYLSDNHATVIAEYQQDLPRPGTLTAYDVDAQAVLDLTDPTVRRALGLDDAFLRQPWKHTRDIERRRPSCWDFVAATAAAGCHGLRVPSVQAPGTNLVLWRWNDRGSPVVRHVDPLGDLPRDQASWPG